jgi:hypothetical protein
MKGGDKFITHCYWFAALLFVEALLLCAFIREEYVTVLWVAPCTYEKVRGDLKRFAPAQLLMPHFFKVRFNAAFPLYHHVISSLSLHAKEIK